VDAEKPKGNARERIAQSNMIPMVVFFIFPVNSLLSRVVSAKYSIVLG